MVKPPCPTAETLVRALLEKESRLNSNLLLCYCVVERLILEVELRTWKLVNISSFGCPCGVFLRENHSLSELEHKGFLVCLVVDWVCYMQVRDCKWGCVWRRIWSRILWISVLWNVPGKTESSWWWRHIKILNIQMLQLHGDLY